MSLFCCCFWHRSSCVDRLVELSWSGFALNTFAGKPTTDNRNNFLYFQRIFLPRATYNGTLVVVVYTQPPQIKLQLYVLTVYKCAGLLANLTRTWVTPRGTSPRIISFRSCLFPLVLLPLAPRSRLPFSQFFVLSLWVCDYNMHIATYIQQQKPADMAKCEILGVKSAQTSFWYPSVCVLSCSVEILGAFWNEKRKKIHRYNNIVITGLPWDFMLYIDDKCMQVSIEMFAR